MSNMSKTIWSIAGLLAMVGFVASGCASQSKAKSGDKKEHPGKKKGEEHPGDKKESQEHPGDKQEGEEHPGKESGEEHPGDEHPGGKAQEDVTASDIKTAMKSHIKSETANGNTGVFEIKDKKADKALDLKFVKIHDPVREMPEKGYFACTDFHVKGKKAKLYDLDFWLQPSDNGELEVVRTKIHKHPKKKDGEWVKEARYTFQNDKIVKLD